MVTLEDELRGQPEALRAVIEGLQQDFGRLERLGSAPQNPIFTGMGASYHAACIAGLHLNSLGIPALALEAADLVHYGKALLEDDPTVVFISQSGASGEVMQFLRTLQSGAIPAGLTLIAVTNEPGSPLAGAAQHVLPLNAGPESLVASKTYLNTLAVLWLLARRWGGAWVGDELQRLESLAERARERIATIAAGQPLFESLEPSQPLLFTGPGPHAATARQAAMLVSEWAKRPALHTSLAALRHGFIESVRPEVGVVIFAAARAVQPASHRLAAELHGYGARVWLVVEGQVYAWDAPLPGQGEFDEFLSPALDILPVQFYADRLARNLGIPPGFRYIEKIVREL